MNERMDNLRWQVACCLLGLVCLVGCNDDNGSKVGEPPEAMGGESSSTGGGSSGGSSTGSGTALPDEDRADVTAEAINGMWQRKRTAQTDCDVEPTERTERENYVRLELRADGTSMTGHDCPSLAECHDYSTVEWSYRERGDRWLVNEWFTTSNEEGVCSVTRRGQELTLRTDGTLVTVSHLYRADTLPDNSSFGCSSAPINDFVCEYHYTSEYVKVSD